MKLAEALMSCSSLASLPMLVISVQMKLEAYAEIALTSPV